MIRPHVVAILFACACDPQLGSVLDTPDTTGTPDTTDTTPGPCDPACWSCTATGCDPIAALVPGRDAACVLLASGRTVCWGRPGPGLFGDHIAGTAYVPPRVTDASFSAFALGADLACGIDPSGVACRGDNYYGALGPDVSRRGSLELVPIMPARGTLALGAPGTACLVADAQATCWGLVLGGAEDHETGFTTTPPTPIAGLPTGDLQLGLGAFFGCGWSKTDVACFGSNLRAQLGLGEGIPGAAAARPVALDALPAGPELVVAVGATHTCAARGGALACWGELAPDDHAWTPRVIATDLPTPVALAAGRHFTCAVLGPDRDLRCWGALAAPPLTGVERLAAAFDHALVQTADGVFDLGVDSAALDPIAAPTPTVCPVDEGFVALGAAHPNTPCQRCAGPSFEPCLTCTDAQCAPITQLAAGDANSCALAAGVVTCWGQAAAIDPTATSPILAPTTLAMPRLTTLALGAQHGCGLDATGAVHCWGSGPSAAAFTPATHLASGAGWTCTLGAAITCSDGTTTYTRPAASTVRGQPSGPSRTLSVNAISACAAPAEAYSHQITCWSHADPQTPVTLPIGVADRIGGLGAGPAEHFAWELTGPRLLRWTPPATATLGRFGWAYNLIAVGAGEAHACALDTTGAVTCWGSQDHGALGPGAAASDDLVAVPAPTPVQLLAVGGRHTCAATRAGSVLCWGDNRLGQLGGGQAGSDWSPTPRRVGPP